MKLKTSSATPLQIDWAVAKCEGLDVYIPAFANKPWLQYKDCHGQAHHCPSWSTDWAHGGPIIEREFIRLTTDTMWLTEGKPVCWVAEKRLPPPERTPFASEVIRGVGPTPLVAAMRCYVASKLGNEVEIPEEIND